MKLFRSLSVALVLLSSMSAFADHRDELFGTYPGAKNTRLLVGYEGIRSAKVVEELKAIDLAFEAADGYYDYLKQANYMVFNSQGKLLGFMHAALMTYTEDDDLELYSGYVSPRGKRVGGANFCAPYNPDDEEDLNRLPPELRPTAEELREVRGDTE